MTEYVREDLIVSLAVGTYIVAVSEANFTCVWMIGGISCDYRKDEGVNRKPAAEVISGFLPPMW